MATFRLEPGADVQIRGLTERSDLNGEIGVVQDFNPKNGRWTVALKTPSHTGVFHVKSENLGQPSPEPMPGLGRRLLTGFREILEVGLSGMLRGHGRADDAAEDLALDDGSFKILMLGQTGSGKTSLLNLFCNVAMIREYGYQDSMEKFHEFLSDKCREFQDSSIEHARDKASESKTSAAKVYKVQWENAEHGTDDESPSVRVLPVRLIDTPGFGDTRGFEEDKKHVQRIIEAIKTVNQINAVLIVMNGREARFSPQLKYVLGQVGAQLPRSVLENVVVVFTNCASALDLNCEPTELRTLFPKDFQSFYIENPCCKIMKARAMHKASDSRRLGDDLAQGLKKSFTETTEQLDKLIAAVSQMTAVPTRDFLRLHQMQVDIERGMSNLLERIRFENASQDKLKTLLRELEAAEGQAAVYAKFETEHSVKRWVLERLEHIEGQDEPPHGTICGHPGCHVNCHVPCKMPSTIEKDVFKSCMAFYWTAKTVEVKSQEDKALILEAMQEQTVAFNQNQDSPDGVKHIACLRATADFSVGGVDVMKNALIWHKGQWLTREGLQAMRPPMSLQFNDRSDPDRCKKCGHSYMMHYHDTARWVEQTETETLIDDKMKRQFDEAKNAAEERKALADAIQRRIQESNAKKDELSKKLVQEIMAFQSQAVSSSYMKLISQQIEVVKTHIEVAQQEGHDPYSLQQTLADLETQLTMVKGVLQQCWEDKDPRFKKQWATRMLGVAEGASKSEVEKAYKRRSMEYHPDKGGEELLFKALGHAKDILLG